MKGVVGVNISFKVGLILGIGGMVNLFIMFIDYEFSWLWFVISLVFLLSSNLWLLKRKISKRSEEREVYWAQHGVWSVGVLAIIFGIFKNGGIPQSYIIYAGFLVLLIVMQFNLYKYKLKMV